MRISNIKIETRITHLPVERYLHFYKWSQIWFASSFYSADTYVGDLGKILGILATVREGGDVGNALQRCENIIVAEYSKRQLFFEPCYAAMEAITIEVDGKPYTPNYESERYNGSITIDVARNLVQIAYHSIMAQVDKFVDRMKENDVEEERDAEYLKNLILSLNPDSHDSMIELDNSLTKYMVKNFNASTPIIVNTSNKSNFQNQFIKDSYAMMNSFGWKSDDIKKASCLDLYQTMHNARHQNT